MSANDRGAAAALARQEPVVKELVHAEVEHGVLIPLKTIQELRDDHATGSVLITRTPVKCANGVIKYASQLWLLIPRVTLR